MSEESKKEYEENVAAKADRAKEFRNGMTSGRFYAAVIGKQVVVTLLGGNQLVGRFVGYDNFDVTVSTPDAVMLIAKHGIESIAVTRGDHA